MLFPICWRALLDKLCLLLTVIKMESCHELTLSVFLVMAPQWGSNYVIQSPNWGVQTSCMCTNGPNNRASAESPHFFLALIAVCDSPSPQRRKQSLALPIVHVFLDWVVNKFQKAQCCVFFPLWTQETDVFVQFCWLRNCCSSDMLVPLQPAEEAQDIFHEERISLNSQGCMPLHLQLQLLLKGTAHRARANWGQAAPQCKACFSLPAAIPQREAEEMLGDKVLQDETLWDGWVSVKQRFWKHSNTLSRTVS